MKLTVFILALFVSSYTYANINFSKVQCKSGKILNVIHINTDIDKKVINYRSRYDNENIPLKKIIVTDDRYVMQGLRENGEEKILIQISFPNVEELNEGDKFKNVSISLSRYIDENGARVTAFMTDVKCKVY